MLQKKGDSCLTQRWLYTDQKCKQDWGKKKMLERTESGNSECNSITVDSLHTRLRDINKIDLRHNYAPYDRYK